MMGRIAEYLEALVYLSAIFGCFAMPFVFLALFFFPY